MGIIQYMKLKKLPKERIQCYTDAMDSFVAVTWETGSEIPLADTHERLGGLVIVTIIAGGFI